MGYLSVGFPIRKSPDHSSFAAPRSLSQLITSFIGSWCQGIPLALFVTWPFVETDEANSANPAWLTPCVIRSLASSFLLSNQNPLTLGFWFVKRTKTRCSLRSLFNTSQLIDSPIGSLYSWIMQAHVSRSFLAKNCIFTHLSFEIETEKKFPLLLPSHNCIIITMFSFQGTWWNLLETPGGDKRDRTADLLNAIQALSQLSYTPIWNYIHSSSVLWNPNLDSKVQWETSGGGPKWTRTIDLTIISRVL